MDVEVFGLKLDNNVNRLIFQIYNKRFEYPYVWLRDNCQCELCFEHGANSRIIDWKDFDINSKPREAKLIKYGIVVIWKDGHRSVFDVNWLKKRCFLKEYKEQYLNGDYKPAKVPWNEKTFESIFRRFRFDDVMSSEFVLKEWLEAWSVYGVALVTGAGSDLKACKKLADRIEFIKKTHYGEDWMLKATPGATNVAYLLSNLQLHTDSPYYEYKPGVNILHCITQTKSEGGGNLLCDGLYVAQQLKQQNKIYYDVLAKTLVDWENIGEEKGNKFHCIHRAPVICLNVEGEIIGINYSMSQRSSHLVMDIEKVELWYKALRYFVDIMYKHSAEFKVPEGDILCFDNVRLIHGRTAFVDSTDNTRCIIGAYMDWDFIDSRMRILKK